MEKPSPRWAWCSELSFSPDPVNSSPVPRVMTVFSSDSLHSSVWLTPKVRKIMNCYPAFQGLVLVSSCVRGQCNEHIHYVVRRCQLNFQFPSNHSREKRTKLIELRPNGCQGHGSPGEPWEEWRGHRGQEMKKVAELIGERSYAEGQKDNFKVALRRLITSMVSKIITTRESLCSKFFLSMGSFRWTTVILVIIKAAELRRAQHWGRHPFSSTTMFRTVTLGQSPRLPETQLPHLEDGYDWWHRCHPAAVPLTRDSGCTQNTFWRPKSNTRWRNYYD